MLWLKLKVQIINSKNNNWKNSFMKFEKNNLLFSCKLFQNICRKMLTIWNMYPNSLHQELLGDFLRVYKNAHKTQGNINFPSWFGVKIHFISFHFRYYFLKYNYVNNIYVYIQFKLLSGSGKFRQKTPRKVKIALFLSERLDV